MRESSSVRVMFVLVAPVTVLKFIRGQAKSWVSVTGVDVIEDEEVPNNCGRQNQNFKERERTGAY